MQNLDRRVAGSGVFGECGLDLGSAYGFFGHQVGELRIALVGIPGNNKHGQRGVYLKGYWSAPLHYSIRPWNVEHIIQASLDLSTYISEIAYPLVSFLLPSLLKQLLSSPVSKWPSS